MGKAIESLSKVTGALVTNVHWHTCKHIRSGRVACGCFLCLFFCFLISVLGCLDGQRMVSASIITFLGGHNLR